MYALISVSDNTGSVDFARELHALGVHLLRENDAVKPVDRENRPVRVEVQETPAVAEDASAALDAGADRLNAEIAG